MAFGIIFAWYWRVPKLSYMVSGFTQLLSLYCAGRVCECALVCRSLEPCAPLDYMSIVPQLQKHWTVSPGVLDGPWVQPILFCLHKLRPDVVGMSQRSSRYTLYIFYLQISIFQVERTMLFLSWKLQSFLLITNAASWPCPASVPCMDRWQDIACAICGFSLLITQSI